jgi:hypothetical protein
VRQSNGNQGKPLHSSTNRTTMSEPTTDELARIWASAYEAATPKYGDIPPQLTMGRDDMTACATAAHRALYNAGRASRDAELRAILEPLRELEANATPGPWLGDSGDAKWDTPKLCGYDSREHHRGPPYYCTGPRTDTAEQASGDANLIAAARNALPKLLALLDGQTPAERD